MQIPVEDIVNILITATLFVVILAGFIVLLVKLFDKAKKNFALEKENIGKEFQTQLLQTQLEIQEQTLEKISQEIHDNIGQALSFVKLNMNSIDVNNPGHVEAKLEESKGLITRTIQDLRGLSKILNTGYLNNVGLVTGIEHQLTYLQKTGVYETRLEVSVTTWSYPPETEIVLFRIVQELLNNIVKHADASVIKVVLCYQETELRIAVSDNGKGFDPAILNNRPETKGLGLGNMGKRLSMIHATFTVDTEPGKGACIVIKVPNAENPAESIVLP
jgi:two-component system NarL family sensor kinase